MRIVITPEKRAFTAKISRVWWNAQPAAAEALIKGRFETSAKREGYRVVPGTVNISLWPVDELLDPAPDGTELDGYVLVSVVGEVYPHSPEIDGIPPEVLNEAFAEMLRRKEDRIIL